ncbi:helix-turn-helix domain-containing protein [Aurantibacter aestuarii]|uniref:DNA-binding protein n=1 Tax=Aurantibacter aestuarii TaxID=1266046 RepID=A0A2T1N728_9FLAO|nr:helix-turn-helix domain-containing protein [Aurantibacter aestuarii]PSG87384.1 DNA-binding protein [Aurantibacter aestuarii]
MENPFEIIMNRLDEIEVLINKIKVNEIEKKELLTIKEVADFLKLTVPTIYGYTHRNLIPYIKKGRKLYFYKNEIEEWLMEGKKSSTRELNIRVNKYLMGI